MPRAFDHDRVWLMNPDTCHHGVELLGTAIRARWPIQTVIGIGRGGWVPASALAELLSANYVSITASYNIGDDIESPAADDVYVDLGNLTATNPRRDVLVVDDVAGTGRTISKVVENLRNRGFASIHTATLCLNEGCEVPPDVWVWTVRDWVVFPWELRSETRRVDFLPLVECVHWREHHL